jgi:hypothetical protein
MGALIRSDLLILISATGDGNSGLWTEPYFTPISAPGIDAAREDIIRENEPPSF